jgi:chromosomal replication initiator protein
MDDMEIVSALLAQLAERVGRDRYELWFGGQTRLSLQPTALVISTPNRFYQDWLRTHFRRELEEVTLTVLGRALPLEFRINSELQSLAPQTIPAPTQSAETTNSTQEANDGLTPTILAIRGPQPKHTHPPKSAAKKIDAVTSQPARSRRWLGLDSFVTGYCNRVAHAAIQQVAEHPGEPNPLLLYGGTGTGKTHLLEGLVSTSRIKHPERNCVYLTAEQFTTQFLEALHGRGLPMFRRKYRTVDLLVIDDVQFLAGKRATLTEFLHTLDTLHRERRQVVITSDRAPHELQELGQQLSTRVAGGMTARLDAPDFPTRLGITRQFARKHDLNLTDDIVELVATQLSEHARELAGAVQRLALERRLIGRDLTLCEAEEALSEVFHRRGHGWKLNDIETAVCSALGLPPESLQSERRAKSLNTTRMLAMWLARKYTRAALSEIGTYFGRRSHSTVIAAQKKVGGWVNEQSQIAFGGKTWSVEEAIRRVEDQLRASG